MSLPKAQSQWLISGIPSQWCGERRTAEISIVRLPVAAREPFEALVIVLHQFLIEGRGVCHRMSRFGGLTISDVPWQMLPDVQLPTERRTWTTAENAEVKAGLTAEDQKLQIAEPIRKMSVCLSYLLGQGNPWLLGRGGRLEHNLMKTPWSHSSWFLEPQRQISSDEG